MNMKESDGPKPYMNPYLAGVILGLTLLGSYLIMGAGLGASAGIARIAAHIEGTVAPGRVATSEYFGAWGKFPLNYYLVFMFLGVFLGGMFSAVQGGRIKFQVERGRRASRKLRLLLALAGGILAGFASRLAQGCTSGQALSGSAMLLSGSLVFLLCIFAGGYAAAVFVRRQWHD